MEKGERELGRVLPTPLAKLVFHRKIMPIKDPVERRRRFNEWQHRNLERRMGYKKNLIQKRVEWFKKYKSQLGCKYCGESEAVCLDFHHRDPLEKDRPVAMIVRNYGIKRLMAELAKCDVVCANCHRKIHAGLLGDRAARGGHLVCTEKSQQGSIP